MLFFIYKKRNAVVPATDRDFVAVTIDMRWLRAEVTSIGV